MSQDSMDAEQDGRDDMRREMQPLLDVYRKTNKDLLAALKDLVEGSLCHCGEVACNQNAPEIVKALAAIKKAGG